MTRDAWLYGGWTLHPNLGCWCTLLLQRQAQSLMLCLVTRQVPPWSYQYPPVACLHPSLTHAVVQTCIAQTSSSGSSILLLCVHVWAVMHTYAYMEQSPSALFKGC